ncbi:MAG: hypothetical protein FJY21_07280 [Bacteroidetes bacterium]|nr:hypothetical protein [Bacteroidota bacterium]
MKYCVLIKISKQQLSFWYQLDGGVYTPLSINGPNTIPLCFYVNGNDFNVGEFAKERFLLNDRNAYNNYFELIKDPAIHFTLHGDSKPVKQLLYYGVENYLSHFIKTILYKNESIEGFRTSFCLRFWFDDDIENQEKVLVENLFKEAGYENISEVDSDRFLNKELSQEIKSSKSRVCLSAISNDLYVKLFSSPEYKLAGQIKLIQLGSDPRAKILAKLILEDIQEASPHIYIEEEKEIAFIINHCAQILSSLSPIMRNEITLSTGVKTDYKVRLVHLEERLMYNRGIEDKVIPQLENILSANGMNINSVDIVLIGDDLNTNYFKDKLTKKFSNVYGIGSAIEAKLLKSIFAEINSNGYQLHNKAPIADSARQVLNDANTTAVNSSSPVNTPPVIKAPPVPNVPKPVNAPPVPPTRTIIPPPTVPSAKPEVKSPPIVKPKDTTPPVNKEVKKVVAPPLPPAPPKAKTPPPPPPPPPPPKKK